MALPAIRWTKELAGQEFGIDHRSLSGRLRRLGIDPGKDSKFSTAEICRAVFGDYEGERLRKTREEADKLALENEKTRGNLVEIEAVYKHFEGYFIALRARILSSGLADDEKDEILNDLRKIKARDVAKPDSGSCDSRQAVVDPDAAAAP